jgi:hypothetical protein
MSEPPGSTHATAAIDLFEDNIAAPFVYFDIVTTHALFNDVIQIELAARVAYLKDGVLSTKFLTSGRLRCSQIAARRLRDSLDEVLKFVEQALAGKPAKMN